MSERMRALVLTRWQETADGFTVELPDAVDAADGDSFTVKQVDADPANALVNVALVEFDGAEATLDAIADLPGAVVLSSERYDAETGQVLSDPQAEAPDEEERAEAAEKLDKAFPELSDNGKAILSGSVDVVLDVVEALEKDKAAEVEKGKEDGGKDEPAGDVAEAITP